MCPSPCAGRRWWGVVDERRRRRGRARRVPVPVPGIGAHPAVDEAQRAVLRERGARRRRRRRLLRQGSILVLVLVARVGGPRRLDRFTPPPVDPVPELPPPGLLRALLLGATRCPKEGHS